MKVVPSEIRAAKKFLQSKKLQDILPANKFARAAKELDLSFKDTLGELARTVKEDDDGRRDS
tara:strand:- start:3884 stop:4069 length:186 start_codon:yes stop_codon:yes gene_type:complete